MSRPTPSDQPTPSKAVPITPAKPRNAPALLLAALEAQWASHLMIIAQAKAASVPAAEAALRRGDITGAIAAARNAVGP